MKLGDATERLCANSRCSYQVSSMSVGTYSPARRTSPTECPVCGSRLVSASEVGQ